MRRDLILPLLLVVGLGALVGYATTEDEDAAPTVATTPATCEAEPLGRLADLPEASGLASARGTPQLFWVHNDSAEPLVIGVGPTGETRARVRIAGATVVDWEAITAAPCASGTCLMVGDIGDNDANRAHITIYRMREPSPDDRTADDVTALDGRYPEGPQDAEAMFIADDTLFIVTKGDGAPVRLYRFPSMDASTPQRLVLVAELTAGPASPRMRVTDAAASPDGRWIALRSNDLVLFYEARSLLQGRAGTPLSFDVRDLDEPQGEGLAWPEPHTLFLAGEGDDAGTFARISCNLPR